MSKESTKTALSDREWRQSRRTLERLDFEPVPETPPLVPRSFYGEIAEPTKPVDAENGEISIFETQQQESFLSPCALDGPLKKSLMESESSPELPSESVGIPATHPISTASCQTSSPVLLESQPSSYCTHLDFTGFEAQLVADQGAIRLSVMAALGSVRAAMEKEADFTRMKMIAAHSNDVTMLQNKIEELKEYIVRTDVQDAQRAEQSDRLIDFMARRAQRQQFLWQNPQSIRACLHAWRSAVHSRQTKEQHKRLVQRHVYKRSLRNYFQAWRGIMQSHRLALRLDSQQEQHAHQLVETVNEYQLTIQQLRQELEDAKVQVATSQKCQQRLEENLRQVFLRGVSAMNIEALTLFNTSHHQSSILQDVNSSKISRSSNIPAKSMRSSFRSTEPDNDQSFRRSSSSVQESSIFSEEDAGDDVDDDVDDVDAVPFETPPSPHQPLNVTSGLHGSLHKLFPSTTASKSDDASSVSSSRSNPLTPPPPIPVPIVNTSAERLIQHERTRSSSISNRPPAFSSIGLRSARRNYVSPAMVRPSHATVVPSRAALQHRFRSQVDSKYQVELEYMRSAVTAAGVIHRSRPTSSSNSNSFGNHCSSRRS